MKQFDPHNPGSQMIFTLKALAEGRLRVTEGKVVNEKGEEIGSLLLNDEIEGYLRKVERE